MLDGYDELSSEQQQKVREAVEQGHVADEDWKGVRFPLAQEALGTILLNETRNLV